MNISFQLPLYIMKEKSQEDQCGLVVKFGDVMSNLPVTYFGVLYKHETLHSHRACQTIVDVELFGTMPVSYFQLWENLSVAYDKRNSFREAGRKRKRYFCFDNMRIYCVLNSSNYCVIIDSSEKQKLI